MKFIGQHIVNLIARFRSSIYLEGVKTGTIASGGNLGLDSDNKIVKDSGVGATDLHGAGVDGAANQLLTDNGDGTVTSEPTLLFTSDTLSIGGDNADGIFIKRQDHGDGGGGHFNIAGSNGTGTNQNGGALKFYGGQGTGTGDGGDIEFWAAADGTSGSSLNGFGALPRLKVDADGDTTISGNLNILGTIYSSGDATVFGNDIIFEGTSDDVHEVTLSGGNPGSDITVTLPASTGTLALQNEDTTGNAATATTLEAARDIGGVSFNGSASINLPGVNTAGNQNTSGTAAGLSATLSVNNGGTGATTFASNSLLTGNSTSAIQAEAELTYDSDTLLIGPDDLTSSYIKKRTHSDGGGGSLQMWAAEGGGTDKTGGILGFYAGASTGTASGGNIRFYTCPPTGDSDADVNPHVLRMSIEADGEVNFNNNVVRSFHRKLTPTSTSTSGDADGDVVYFGNGPGGAGSTTAGYIYFYKGTGNWELADADSTTLGGNGFLAVSIGTDPSTDGMLVRGMVTHHVEIEGTEGQGAILYLSTTTGVATVDPPTSSGDLVRIIGYALDTDNDQMYFNPSMDWIEIA